MHAGSIPARASTSRATRESAALAQLVEHIIRNDGVTCSSHVSGTTFREPQKTAISEAELGTSYLIASHIASHSQTLRVGVIPNAFGGLGQ